MNTKERFLKALRRDPVDRVPVACVATGITVEMQERRGIFWPEAHRNAASLAGLAESIHLYTDIECIKLPFDMAVEVEALGAEVDYRTRDTLPSETTHPFTAPEQVTMPPDFFSRGRVPVVLQAVSTLRKRYEDEIPIVASMVGPFTLAEKLFGFDEFLTWPILSPEAVHEAMRRLTPLTIAYTRALVEAGADAITIGEAGCSGNLISHRTYREFILPYHQQLCASVSAPTILHICGRSTGHTRHIAESGATAYNFDEGVDLPTARQNLAGRVALTGNVPTMSVLLDGTPEETYASALQCLEAGVNMLTPGCALAPHTPLANLAALAQAARDHRPAA